MNKNMSRKSSGKIARLDKVFQQLGFEKPEPIRDIRDIPRLEKIKIGYRKENDCGKTCYDSESMCNQAMRRRLNLACNTSKLRSYFCETCKAWHMTSSFHKKIKS